MKYLSTFLFLAAMIWTWGLSRGESAISQQAHVNLQEDLKKLIADFILANDPNSSNLRFERFWTEAINDNKVRATFIYSFDTSNQNAGDARLQLEGTAIVDRVSETKDNIEWELDESSIRVTSNLLEYKDPMTVTPGEDKDDPAASLPTTTPTPAQKPAGH